MHASVRGARLTERGNYQVKSKRLLAGLIVFGVLVLLTLIAVAVSRHPGSVQGAGKRLLLFDIVVLLAYMAVGVWLWLQKRKSVVLAASLGAGFGLLLGAVQFANHFIELFVAQRPFALIIGPVFMMLAVFGTAGSVVRQRTRAFVLALIGGECCAVAGILITLILAFLLNLSFEENAEAQLRLAFTSSGLSDPGVFLVRTMLLSTSEGLIRMPILAAILSFIGAVTNALTGMVSRRIVFALTLITPLMFVVGAGVLWYADLIERASRPPFILGGVALSGVALCSAHGIISAFRKQSLLPG